MKVERELMKKIKKLLEKMGIVYVATADRKGTPHIAAAEGMTFTDEGQILFRAWFCLKTVQIWKRTQSSLLPS